MTAESLTATTAVVATAGASEAIDGAGVAHILRVDPQFGPIVAAAGPFAPRAPVGDAFNALVRAIVYQQLNGRAAATIHGRLLARLGGQASAEAVLKTPLTELRAAGLSGSKAASVVDLATKTSDGTVPLERIEALEDEEIVRRLTRVRGVGRWTAEMFLIFQLRRLDVWPVDDFGVRKGFRLIHGMSEALTPRALESLGELYRPYRSVAAWYCWRATDTRPQA